MTETSHFVVSVGVGEYLDDNGQRHRVDGPAAFYPDGTKYWYLHGKLHRVDGPAVTRGDGRTEWWIEGERRRDIEEAFAEQEKSVLRREETTGHREYLDVEGRFHRADGPAVTHPNGRESWFFHGVRHRVDGPAVTNPDGSTEWWMYGRRALWVEDLIRSAEQEANR